MEIENITLNTQVINSILTKPIIQEVNFQTVKAFPSIPVIKFEVSEDKS